MKAEYKIPSPLFAKATVVVTAGVHHRMEANKEFARDVTVAVMKFQALDWGDTCASDCQTNEDCLKTGDRIFAVYHTCNGRIYVIADAVMDNKPYNIITVLFPSEY